jgi:hypothetical protein
MDIDTGYKHRVGAHCETCVTTGLINHHGGNVTEPLVFGTGSGLNFAHIPFLKMQGLPLTSFRAPAGSIMRNSLKRLGVQATIRRFKDQDEAMRALDSELEKGIPVGLQVGVYWLPFISEVFRIHLNLHNIVVTGRKGTDYLVSDFLCKEIAVCPAKDLRKARFSQGEMAPRGKMVSIQKVPARLSLAHAASAGIRGVCSTMLQPIFPIVGVKAIRYIAGKMERWPSKLGAAESRRNLGNVILMQEEIGTGGAGFRYMFAAFLEESAGILKEDKLLRLSSQMTQTGDKWRAFGAQAARYCKGRSQDGEGFPSMAALLRECADEEESIYRELKKITPKIPAGEAA